MQYHVGCRCGKQLAVKADAAGTTIPCPCGERVSVPPLSKLREMVGIGAYESRAIDTISRMREDGTLPLGETCAVSGRPTRDLILLEVRCEPDDGWRDRLGSWIVLAYFIGLWAIIIGYIFKPFAGRDPANVVTLPLRVAREFHRGLARWGTQRKLRRLLSTVPVYSRLLEEYPRARIWVDRTSARRWTERPEGPVSAT